jgi:predicted transcriptional regulator
MKIYLLYPTEDQEKMILTFLETNQISFFEEEEELPQYVLDGIKRGQEDAAAGRTITLDEFKKQLSSSK